MAPAVDGPSEDDETALQGSPFPAHVPVYMAESFQDHLLPDRCTEAKQEPAPSVHCQNTREAS